MGLFLWFAFSELKDDIILQWVVYTVSYGQRKTKTTYHPVGAA